MKMKWLVATKPHMNCSFLLPLPLSLACGNRIPHEHSYMLFTE